MNTEHDRDHDLGLAHDLPRLLGRRRLLQIAGLAGVGVLIGCGDDDDGAAQAADSTTTSAAAAGSTSSTTTAASGGECSVIPEETGGPFPGDGTNGPNVLSESGVVRSDITSSFGSSSTVAGGVPLDIVIDVQNTAAGCGAMAGAAVYVWHCDREGRYSMYSSGVEDENYLRGVQEADANGRVSFRSVFPGAYSGRWPHIHFEVYSTRAEATAAGSPVATSQIALPPAACQVVYDAADGYEQSVVNLAQTSLQRDGVFGDDGAIHQLGSASGSVADGYSVQLTVPV